MKIISFCLKIPTCTQEKCFRGNIRTDKNFGLLLNFTVTNELWKTM